MFGKKEEQKPAVSAQPAVKTDDMIVHVMPREFADRAVTPVAAPPVMPKPVVVPPVPAPAPIPVAPSQPAVKPPVPPPSRKKFGLLVVLFLLLFVLAVGGVGTVYYLYFMPVEPVPVVQPEPVAEPIPVPVPEPVPAEPQPGKDTDSDGLTDVEELLYGTDYRNPDTDNDTFLDGNEVFHRYNPNGLAPLTLLDTGAVRVFQSPDMPFTIYYPSAWTPVADLVQKKVSFRSPSTAAVIVTVEIKDAVDSLEVWYEANAPSQNAQQLEATYTTEGLLAMARRDERIAYVDGGSNVFTLTYDLGDEETIEFLTTFQMMLNGLTLLP